MIRKQMRSVGDVAHVLQVHEEVVMAWARRHDVPRVGREFVLSARDVRELERWLEAAGSVGDRGPADDEADDGDEEPGDAEHTEGDDDEDDDLDDGDDPADGDEDDEDDEDDG